MYSGPPCRVSAVSSGQIWVDAFGKPRKCRGPRCGPRPVALPLATMIFITLRTLPSSAELSLGNLLLFPFWFVSPGERLWDYANIPFLIALLSIDFNICGDAYLGQPLLWRLCSAFLSPLFLLHWLIECTVRKSWSSCPIYLFFNLFIPVRICEYLFSMGYSSLLYHLFIFVQIIPDLANEIGSSVFWSCLGVIKKNLFSIVVKYI